MLCPGWLAGGMLGGEGEGHTVSIHLPTDRRRRQGRRRKRRKKIFRELEKAKRDNGM